MNTEWSHLPNSAHIDRVLASVAAHPDIWARAWDRAWDRARSEAYNRARSEAYNRARSEAYNRAWYEAWDRARAYNRARGAARGAIMALIAYDDSSKYLNMKPLELKVWGTLSEDPACILLLPAVMAFEQIKELELT